MASGTIRDRRLTSEVVDHSADVPSGGVVSIEQQSLGAYDIRKGAAGYATIMGSIGGFAVPTVILVFGMAHKEVAAHRPELTLLVGLLVLTLLGCIASAFAFSAIGGEELLTANLPAAAMYIGVCVILSITAILGAFEILAHIYFKSATNYFAFVTAAGGITGAIYNCLSVVDDWEIRQGRIHELGHSEWFRSRRHAHVWAGWLAVIGCVPIVIGLLVYLTGAGPNLTPSSAEILAGAGLGITMLTVIRGAIRSLHSSKGSDRGIHATEVVLLQLVTGLSLCALLIFLPK